MIHQRQRLPLGFEAGDHLPSIHAGLDDFQRHLAADRLLLLGHEDDAEAPFADLLQELVWADDGAGALGDRVIDGGDDTKGGSVRPAQKRSWTSSALAGSSAASLVRASSSASRSCEGVSVKTAASFRSTRCRSPPCLGRRLRRALSIKIRRIASAAAAKKWPRLSQDCPCSRCGL